MTKEITLKGWKSETAPVTLFFFFLTYIKIKLLTVTGGLRENPNNLVVAEPRIALGSMANQEYEEQRQQPQELGYDPNFVPDSVKSFVVHLYRHIREKNVYEIHQMYESSFQTLSERLFKDTPWPSVDAVAHYVDNDHVFCLLYREMWFRHLYARLTPTLRQRIDSWDNYCSLFQVVLHGVVNMQLPNQWLWDMVDEFVYQFQSFCQYRAKMKNKTEQEIALLRQFDQVTNWISN